VKLNDFKKLDEAQMLGSFGSALMKNMGNKMRGSGMGAMSTVDQMTKDNYIKNFLGAASSSLNSAIQGDLVDPKATSTATPSPAPQPGTGGNTPPATAPAPGGNAPPATAPAPGGNAPPAAPGAPKTPEQIRKEKQAAAAGVVQKQMAANPAPAKPGAPVAPAAPKTPAQIRQEKQAAATQTAQGQMAKNPAPVKPVAPAAPKTPAQIRQEKQAAATQTAQANMAPYSKVKTAPAVWKNNRKPTAPAQRSPKMAESTTFDKLNYIFESILLEADNSISSFMQKFFTKHLSGLDTSASQAKIKELADLVQQTYSKDYGKAAMTKMANLAYALEHVNGGGAGEETSSSKPLTPAQAMAKGFDGSTATDATDKGTGTSQASADATDKGQAPSQTPADAIASQEAPAPGATQPAADPQKEKTVYMQVKSMLDKLDKKGKQRILAALEKQLGTTGAPASTATPDTSSTTAAPASNNPFGQMASQLTQTGATDTSKVGNATKSSTGGKIQQTTTGTVNTKSRNNPNIKRRTPKVAPVQATEPTPATQPTEPTKQWKGRKAKAPAVAESKRVIKVWGQK
jgi:hypothetical protein